MASRSCEKAGVTFGPVSTVDEAADDEQARDIGALVPFADGKGHTVSSPFHLDTRPRSRRCARRPSASIRSGAERSRLLLRRDRAPQEFLGLLGGHHAASI